MKKPIVVCLCGSTRFGNAFREANLRETLAGKIVLSIGCDFKSDDVLFGTGEFQKYSNSQLKELKNKLDELHLRKIDLADEVLILNVDGYIGESTCGEVNYAINQGKVVRYLEVEDER
uniref:Uncharacterized protein n=1 Tax=viral metagenome TaxID=1070528 RepID=A0A6M3JNI5_9ZZZZ